MILKLIPKKCKQCGSKFPIHRRHKWQPFCNNKCYKEWRAIHGGSGERIIKCKMCGKKVQATNNGQRWCIICRPKRRKEKKRKSDRKYYQQHPEMKEHMRKRFKKLYHQSPEKYKEKQRQVYRKHFKHYQQYSKEYRQKYPEKRKAAKERRNRKLGFMPLNKSFPNSHGHHIDDIRVAYIPKDIHQKYGGGHDVIKHRQLVLGHYGSLENMIKNQPRDIAGRVAL